MVVFWFGLGNLAGSTMFGGASLVIPDHSIREILCITAICVLGAMSDLSKTSAYRLSPAWVVSLLSLLAIPVSAVIAHIFLGERLSLAQIAGIGLMLASLSIAIYRRN